MYNKDEMVLSVFEGLNAILGKEYDIQMLYPEKNNGQIKKAISIHKKNTKLGRVIYLDKFLEAEKEIDEIMELVIDLLENEEIPFDECAADLLIQGQFESVRELVRMKLVNYEANEMELKTVPHVRFLDLAIVFYLVLFVSDEGVASAKIEQQHLDLWGITTETLYQVAMDNMKKYESVQIESMASIMQKIWLKDVTDEEGCAWFANMIFMEKEEYPLYVLFNKREHYGAAGILYSSELEAFAERIQKNIIIIPSSIHECLLLPDIGKISYKAVQNMVVDINGSEVQPEERLSNSVYLYDRVTKNIKIVLQGTTIV